MAMLHGYFDESGKSHEHDIVAFSGFVSTWESWEQMGEEWRRLLRQFNLPSLHFTEHRRQTSLMKKFIQVVRSEVEFGLSVAVKVDAFRALPRSLQEDLGEDAHYLAFRCVVLAMLSRMTVEPGSTIDFTCDEDEHTTLTCYRWYKQIKRERGDARSKLVSFRVADDAHFPQLQAADVFAGISRAEAERELLKKDYDFRELFEYLVMSDEHRRLSFGTLWLDEDTLRPAAQDIDDTIRRLASTGSGAQSLE